MKKVTRREFVKRSAVASAVAPAVLNSLAWGSPNDQLRVAVVGVRGRGRDHIRGFQRLPNVQVVAWSDIDESVLADRVKDFKERGWKKPTTHADFRELLDNPEIDVISFATPNHWHALGTIWACQA